MEANGPSRTTGRFSEWYEDPPPREPPPAPSQFFNKEAWALVWRHNLNLKLPSQAESPGVYRFMEGTALSKADNADICKWIIDCLGSNASDTCRVMKQFQEFRPHFVPELDLRPGHESGGVGFLVNFLHEADTAHLNCDVLFSIKTDLPIATALQQATTGKRDPVPIRNFTVTDESAQHNNAVPLRPVYLRWAIHWNSSVEVLRGPAKCLTSMTIPPRVKTIEVTDVPTAEERDALNAWLNAAKLQHHPELEQCQLVFSAAEDASHGQAAVTSPLPPAATDLGVHPVVDPAELQKTAALKQAKDCIATLGQANESFIDFASRFVRCLTGTKISRNEMTELMKLLADEFAVRICEQLGKPYRRGDVSKSVSMKQPPEVHEYVKKEVKAGNSIANTITSVAVAFKGKEVSLAALAWALEGHLYRDIAPALTAQNILVG